MGNLYTKLAFTSIRKNKVFYAPYIISAAIMIALFFIVTSLAFDPYIQSVHGGTTLATLLVLGIPVLGVLSIFFLFYLSSFIMKRRKKELGLYSILGMEKKHIIAVVSRENFIVAVSSIVLGNVLGLVFYKISQLILLKIIHCDIDLSMRLSWPAMAITTALYALLFGLIFIFSSAEIRLRSTLGYLKSGSVGEKKPKANWFLGILGILLLVAAYFMASAVQETVQAFTLFFPAVILVIIGTYMVFVAGSVFVLNILKKNKDYYYQTKHMISVSGMLYRMKRNGMGLATICILSTMVLVMMSTVTTIILLNQKNMDRIFSHDFCINISPEQHGVEDTLALDPEVVREKLEYTADRTGCEIENFEYYYCLNLIADIQGDDIQFWRDYEDYYQVYITDLESYNRITGQDVSLSDGQIGYICEQDPDAVGDKLSVHGDGPYDTVRLPEVPDIMIGDVMTYSRGDIYLVVGSEEKLVALNELLTDSWYEEFSETGGPSYGDLTYKFITFDVTGDDRQFFEDYSADHMTALTREELEYMNTNWGTWEDGTNEYIFSKGMFTDYFYSLYGGIFFLGIILSLACITIAVLVMYFKQILEGYEDAGKFSIMKKVGLTNEDIKDTIYSQIVMVFFMPLLVAGIHTAFAYHMVKLMLTLFAITDATFYFAVLLICVLVFAIFYGLVFMITSKNYFKLVGNADKAVSSY